jgi:chemotaxis protein MotA
MGTVQKRQPDYATWLGLAVTGGGIIGGLLLEKGQPRDLVQLTALLIVLGGTIGAVLISTPVSVLLRALRCSRVVFFEEGYDERAVVERLMYFAALARRGGILSIEAQVMQEQDPFLRRALLLAVDGVDTGEIRRQLELGLNAEEERAEADARVFETAGGYAPTIGIIGAVLGLIQVMKHLDALGEVGKGIAVAFVSTIYGVGLANLLFLPAAMKIRTRAHLAIQSRQLAIEGVLAIAGGLNPILTRTKLEGMLQENRPQTAPEPRSVASQGATLRDAL